MLRLLRLILVDWTFRHRGGLARVPFEEFSRELQLKYSFRNEPDQSVKIRSLESSRPESEFFLDVRVIGADDPVSPTTVQFTHRDSPTEAITRPLADLQLTAANRAILLGNLNPQPPPVPAVPDRVTFIQALTVVNSEFRDVEIVRVNPDGLVFRHRDGGSRTFRRSFDELTLPDDVSSRFGFERDRTYNYGSPQLITSRRESFSDVTITGIDVTPMPIADRPVRFRHRESGGESIVRRFGDLDAATQAAITDYLAAFPIPAAPTTILGSGVPVATPFFVDIFLPTAASSRSEVFEDIEVVRNDVNGLTFRHRLSGGASIFRRFEDLPDDVRVRFSFKRDGDQGARPSTLRFPALTTALGSVFRDVEVLAAEVNGLVFRHRGGVTKLPFSELPDALRDEYEFKDDRRVALSSSTIRTNRGQVFHDAVILSSDPVGLTFRHRDGTTKVSFADLPGDFRKKFNFNVEDALDFRRAHAFVAPPAPSRRRFLVISNGHVPTVGAGVSTPGVGVGSGVPAIGAGRNGGVPAIGLSGGVPPIAGAFRTPPVGAVGPAPAIGAGVMTPAIGVGK